MIDIHVVGETLDDIRKALADLYTDKAAPTPAPAPAPVPAPATVAAAPAPAPAPVAAAPIYTLEQVAKAGADFVTAHPERMAELQSKLQSYGATSVAELSKDQLGAFATELRAMGGSI